MRPCIPMRASVSRPSVCPSIRLSVCPSVCRSVRLSVCPSVCRSVRNAFSIFTENGFSSHGKPLGSLHNHYQYQNSPHPLPSHHNHHCHHRRCRHHCRRHSKMVTFSFFTETDSDMQFQWPCFPTIGVSAQTTTATATTAAPTAIIRAFSIFTKSF